MLKIITDSEDRDRIPAKYQSQMSEGSDGTFVLEIDENVPLSFDDTKALREAISNERKRGDQLTKERGAIESQLKAWQERFEDQTPDDIEGLLKAAEAVNAKDVQEEIAKKVEARVMQVRDKFEAKERQIESRVKEEQKRYEALKTDYEKQVVRSIVDSALALPEVKNAKLLRPHLEMALELERDEDGSIRTDVNGNPLAFARLDDGSGPRVGGDGTNMRAKEFVLEVLGREFEEAMSAPALSGSGSRGAARTGKSTNKVPVLDPKDPNFNLTEANEYFSRDPQGAAAAMRKFGLDVKVEG